MERIPNSFKDPMGFVYKEGPDIYRVVLNGFAKEWQELIESNLFFDLQKRGYLQKSKILPLEDYRDKISVFPENIIAVIRHEEKIPCISYPYEWSFSMLRDSALFHLDILKFCLGRRFILKDGTPYNIQFKGINPLFLDIFSVMPYTKGFPWVGFNQFSQQFLFPLFLLSYKKIPFHPYLRSRLGGIDIYSIKKFFSSVDVFKPGIFTYIFLPLFFQKTFALFSDSIKEKISSAGIINERIIIKNVNRLYKLIQSLKPPQQFSLWRSYQENSPYNYQDKKAKSEFVRNEVREFKPRFLLDLGTNTGEYSLALTLFCDYIVSVDFDHDSIDVLYRRLKDKKIKNVLPLIIDIVNPSPDLGWNFEERPSFFKRVNPDMVLCLALIHHIVISNNIPVQEFVNWLVKLTPNLIVEFVSKKDPMVKALLKEKRDIYNNYNEKFFEVCLKKYGDIEKKLKLPSGLRTLYYFKRKNKNYEK